MRHAHPLDFYSSPAWLELRARRLAKAGYRCEACFAGPRDGYRLEVHHVLTIAKHPELALEFTNLVALCRACHLGLHWWPQRGTLPAANDPRFGVHPTPPVSPAQLTLDF